MRRYIFVLYLHNKMYLIFIYGNVTNTNSYLHLIYIYRERERGGGRVGERDRGGGRRGGGGCEGKVKIGLLVEMVIDVGSGREGEKDKGGSVGTGTGRCKGRGVGWGR